MIYLDWNATAPLHPAARAAWLAAQDGAWGNPSSIHQVGQEARLACDQTKGVIARHLGAKAHELVVTSGGTEANALAIHAALAERAGTIVCSAIEHSSVLRNAETLGPVVLAPVDGEGRLVPEALVAAVRGARLVCLQVANNETGTLQDLATLIPAMRAAQDGLWIHLDACQGAGKVPLHLGKTGADSASIAGHKIGAPKGIGLLWVAGGHRTLPLLRGGRQQQDRRSGTEDAPGLAALAAALDQAMGHLAEEHLRQTTLLADLWAELSQALPQAVWLGYGAPRLANTLCLLHPGLANEAVVQRLDLAGFAVSKGSACMAARGEPSHVVAACGVERDLARSAIRVSIGSLTTRQDLAAFRNAYMDIVHHS